LYKFFSYCFCFSVLFFLSLTFPSCKTSANAATAQGNKKELTEKEQAQLEIMFIEACREKNVAGKPEVAERLLRECLKIDPKNIPVKYELSKLLQITNRLDEASKLAEECVNADPKNQWYHLTYIETLHLKKDYIKAAAAYEKMIKYFPERSDLVESLAIEYATGKNYAKAFKIYEDLEKRYGQNETFTLNKVKLLKEQGKFNDAEGELKKLIATNPKEPRYQAYLAEHYEEINDFEKAKGVYEKLLILDPNNPMVHLIMANYYKEQGRMEDWHNERKIAFSNPDLSISVKTEILQWYFDHAPDFTAKGYELCDIMLKVHPRSPEAHSAYAEFLIRDKRITEAYEQYLIAARYDKTHLNTWVGLLKMESDLNIFDSLEVHSAMAMELFPNQPIPYYSNGVANMKLRNYKKAAQSFYDGVEFVYDDKTLMLGFYSNLGDVYSFLEEYEKSDKAYDNALMINPDDAYVLNNYAYYLSLRKEKLEKAEKLSKRSNDLVRENPSYIDTYGWILFQQGKFKEAEEWLVRAVKLSSKKPLILEHYGDVMYKLSKPDEALKYWKLSNEAGGNSESLLKKISTKKLGE
jgi:tetratricopeptide (TPR) repeat protein